MKIIYSIPQNRTYAEIPDVEYAEINENNIYTNMSTRPQTGRLEPIYETSEPIYDTINEIGEGNKFIKFEQNHNKVKKKKNNFLNYFVIFWFICYFCFILFLCYSMHIMETQNESIIKRIDDVYRKLK